MTRQQLITIINDTIGTSYGPDTDVRMVSDDRLQDITVYEIDGVVLYTWSKGQMVLPMSNKNS